MVLGVKSSKHKKGAPIRADYIVHIQEIKPWPPSESLKSVQTVLLQWENSDENSGSFLSVAGESNIVFNESFMLPLTLYRRKKCPDKFKKNYLEFTLSEPRKDNKAKGTLLGTASINLVDYGLLVEDVLTVSAPLVFKKIPNCSVQPMLAISLELVEKDSSNDSSRLSHEASLDNDDDDSEITSYTDDDASSHSSRTAGSSTFELGIASPSVSEKSGYGYAGIDLTRDKSKNSWGPPSTDQGSAGTWNKVKDYVSLSKFSERSMTLMKKKSEPPLIISAPILSTSFRDNSGRFNNIIPNSLLDSVSRDVIAGNQQQNTSENTQQNVEDKFFERFAQEAILTDHLKKNGVTNSNSFQEKQNNVARDERVMEDAMKNSMEKRSTSKLSENAAKNQVTMRSDSLAPNRKIPAVPPPNKARLKHVKSENIHGSVKGNGFPSDLDIPQKKGKISAVTERKEPKIDIYDDQKDWKTRAEMLEEELRESAVVEVGLYSVVPEHSSSVNKVHAPARRISRFYNNACGSGSRAKRASAARAAVSGLVLVSKTCGNDVTRLTFWLSNSIMLRSIVSQIATELPRSKIEGQQSKSTEESDDCEDILTFIMALEKIESWLFSRIVESVWWQTFTPHMQPTVVKGGHRDKGSCTKKTSGRKNSLGNHEQAKFSIELWKKAFRDACEKLCPIRAGGHECGCLSVLIILVMGQLVNRLDVAMFNAILRECAEEMPTDPVSDPITDSKVLPVPAGKSSFTAGAQLKNVIGNWSRWLTDLFGLEDDENLILENSINRPKSFKAFRLLHALSDLMMLPFGMLADTSTRKEVCPMFGPSIIKRVLKNFVPDEFSPHPIPRHIVDAINSEEISDSPGDQIITSFPCSATPTKYSRPSAALLTRVGEVGSKVIKSSRLSTLKKSYTSDDELDELDSPLTSIIPDSYQSSSALARLGLMTKEKGSGNVVRYQLLREIWKDEE